MPMRTLLLASLVLTAACGSDGGPQAAGELDVTILVAPGGNADPDGYRIAVEGDTLTVPATGGTVVFPDLAPGLYVVKVLGLAAWCNATPRIQPAHVEAGGETELATTIQCGTAYGAVRFITTFAGFDLDLDGYTITAEGVDHVVGIRDTVIVLLPSERTSQLGVSGIRRTCWTPADSTYTATPTLPGDTVEVQFHVDCGVILYQGFPGGGQPPRFYQVNVTTGEIRPQGTFPNNVEGLRSSPDGSQIVFASNDLYTMTPTGASIVQRTATSEIEFDPSWSADGATLYYSTIEDQRIHRLPLSGGGSTVLPGATVTESNPAEAPDGGLIAFQGSDTSGSKMWLMDPDGSNRRVGYTGWKLFGQPSWSPDGRYLAVMAAPNLSGSGRGISVGTPGVPSPEWPWRSSPLGTSVSDHDPLWSGDGQYIAYVRDPGDGSPQLLRVMDPGGGQSRTIAIPHAWNGEYTWLR